MLKVALVNPARRDRYPQPPMGLALLAAVGVAIWAALSLDPSGDRGAGTGRDYEKEFLKHKKFDLSLVKWSELLPAIPAKMETPVALAVFADGNICHHSFLCRKHIRIR